MIVATQSFGDLRTGIINNEQLDQTENRTPLTFLHQVLSKWQSEPFIPLISCPCSARSEGGKGCVVHRSNVLLLNLGDGSEAIRSPPVIGCYESRLKGSEQRSTAFLTHHLNPSISYYEADLGLISSAALKMVCFIGTPF
jgi:hypothetical protein